MEQVTDVVFRHVIAQAGAPDLWYTEFANATGWVHAGERGIGGRLLKTDDEHPIVAQIWGGEPGDLEAFAKHCASLGFDGIDINMGCPAKSAVKSGGAALIRQPDLAAEAIAAAKKAGLPVSVKTRLGYSSVEEWRGWLTHLLQQDIATLTIHLRTKREMSKVPAHWELIPEIKALRDEIAPQTLLVINGDVKNRKEGEELAAKYGVDGIMIGRGVFGDPFCFNKSNVSTSGLPGHPSLESLTTSSGVSLETRDSEEVGDGQSHGVAPLRAQGDSAPAGNDASGNAERKDKLINLLHSHLNLYDKYANQTLRPYETLKRFFKIYIRDFDGASDIRNELMHTTDTHEAREIIDKYTQFM